MSSLLLLQLSVGFATTSFVITTGTLIARFAVPVLRPQPIVREWLVTSMLFAGLISATNSTVFGLYDMYVRGGSLSPQGSFVCSVSGFLRQFGLQALDLSLCAISVLTIMVLTSKTSNESTMEKAQRGMVYILGAIWTVPLITAIMAYALVGYSPSGGWCWIAENPKPLGTIARYALGHGIRIVIWFGTLVGYGYVFFRMVQLRKSVDRNARSAVQPAQAPAAPIAGRVPSMKVGEFGAAPAKQERDMRAFSVMVPPPSSILGKNAAPGGRSPMSSKSSPFADPLFRSMIIMMLYPITFIILWSGALVNRLVEASGNENFTIGDIMQSPMQLIPGALSIVYLCAQANRLGYLGPRFSVSGSTTSATNHQGVVVPLPEPISVGTSSSSQKTYAQTPSELELGPRVPHLQPQYYQQQRLQSPIGHPGPDGSGYTHFGGPVGGYAPLGPFAQRGGQMDEMQAPQVRRMSVLSSPATAVSYGEQSPSRYQFQQFAYPPSPSGYFGGGGGR